MRRGAKLVCWICLIALLALSPPLWAGLRARRDRSMALDRQGWAGVLRVWVSSGWACGDGSPIPWLSHCAARFEKRHPGVYLQIEPVTSAVLADFSTAVFPPDLIFFAPGMLERAEGLLPLEAPKALRAALAQVGTWGGASYALPVAMGGYAWAINLSLVEHVPLDWRALPDPQPLKDCARYLMQVPADEPWRCWSAALNALCAPRRISAQGEAASSSDPALDLGLEDGPVLPSPSPAQQKPAPCHLPALLPDNFLAASDAYSGFAAGSYAAIPVTQREIRQLELLSEAGRAPDWTVEGGGAAFTDQLLLAGVPVSAHEDGAARAALAEAFCDFLLYEESQNALSMVRALRVTDGPALYGGECAMARLERLLSGALTPAPAFGDGYRREAQSRARALVEDARRTAPAT